MAAFSNGAARQRMMIVPHFWAEARVQYRRAGKQITVRRFGWSDVSQEDAQSNAQARADEALTRAVSGEPMPRREPKVPYNGGNGLPIREEVVARFGETVITRNAYGARCLNTPDTLFVDIDFPDNPSWRMVRISGMFLFVVSVGLLMMVAGRDVAKMWGAVVIGALLALVSAYSVSRVILRVVVWSKGGPVAIARAKVLRFTSTRPDWLVHLYRTPAGLRLIATHRLFDPMEAAVGECFKELAADPVYAAMCVNQHCFRARLSAKPWRIGIEGHLKPRPGIWPVSPERLPERRAWLERYDEAAAGFAACRFLESIGSGVSAPAALAVQQLHDELCQARAKLPIA